MQIEYKQKVAKNRKKGQRRNATPKQKHTEKGKHSRGQKSKHNTHPRKPLHIPQTHIALPLPLPSSHYHSLGQPPFPYKSPNATVNKGRQKLRERKKKPSHSKKEQRPLNRNRSREQNGIHGQKAVRKKYREKEGKQWIGEHNFCSPIKRASTLLASREDTL